MADKDSIECKEIVVGWLFDIICSAAASLIVLILVFLSKKSSGKHPALVMPVNILGGQLKNRWSIAVAFSAMLSTTAGLLFQKNFLFIQSDDKELSRTFSLINLILTVLIYFIVYYPYLACLTSEHSLVASITGFCYVTIRFIIITVNNFGCWNYLKYSVKEFRYMMLLLRLPDVVFSGFLFIRFAFIAAYNIWKRCRKQRVEDGWIKIVDITTLDHVCRLLNPSQNYSLRKKTWTSFFSCSSGFKFSSTTLATVLVSILLVYQVTLILIREILRLTILKFEPFNKIIRLPIIVSLSSSALFTCGMLLHFLISHRKNMLRMFQGDKAFLPEYLGKPSHIVGRSLRFCGFQVASAGWGTLVMGNFLALTTSLTATLVHYWDYIVTPKVVGIIQYIGYFVILPFLGYYLLVYIILELLARYVFREHQFNDVVLGINNRKLFNISVFFFYFHTIIIGVLGVLARVFTGMFLGIFFLSRTDKNLMIQGFHNADLGYSSYVGYLHVLAAHRNPVRVAFCQILVDLLNKQYVVIKKGVVFRNLKDPNSYRRSKRAFNKWCVAVMLINNPTLRKYRKVSDNLSCSSLTQVKVHCLDEKETVSVLHHDDSFLLKDLDNTQSGQTVGFVENHSV